MPPPPPVVMSCGDTQSWEGWRTNLHCYTRLASWNPRNIYKFHVFYGVLRRKRICFLRFLKNFGFYENNATLPKMPIHTHFFIIFLNFLIRLPKQRTCCEVCLKMKLEVIFLNMCKTGQFDPLFNILELDSIIVFKGLKTVTSIENVKIEYPNVCDLRDSDFSIH